LRIRSAVPAKLVRISLVLCLVLGACATDDPEDTDEATGAGTPTPTAAAGETVEITARDYAFDGFPNEMDAGTELSLTNESSGEVHEIVAFRLPSSETRPAADLARLPQAELEQALGGPPVTVIVALPGGEGQTVEGDGTLAEAGRYVFLCFVPTGADPAAYEEAIESQAEEAPDVEGGPPHFVQGMYAEATVS